MITIATLKSQLADLQISMGLMYQSADGDPSLRSALQHVYLASGHLGQVTYPPANALPCVNECADRHCNQMPDHEGFCGVVKS